jgi:hypothetical protein
LIGVIGLAAFAATSTDFAMRDKFSKRLALARMAAAAL